MNLGETARKPVQLGFGQAAVAAHQSVFGHFRRFMKLAALPFAVTLVLAVLEVPASIMVPGSELVFSVVSLLPYAILGVTLTRAILLGEEPGLGARLSLAARTWKYFGNMLLIALILLTPILVLVFGAIGFAYVTGGETELQLAGTGGGWILAVAGILGLFLLLYLSSRLGLALPAVAVDEKLGLRGAWRLTRGGTALRLLGIMIATITFMFLLALVGSMFTGQQVHIGTGLPSDLVLPPNPSLTDVIVAVLPSLVASALVSYIGFGLLTGAYAHAYARLSGWDSPRQEVLERFE